MNKKLTSGQTSESLFIAGRERLFILFCVIAAGMMVFSQSAISQPHFDWVRNYPITGRVAAIDSSGYVYFVGEQTGGTQKILKYDSLGILLWAKNFNVITGSNYLGIAAYKSKYLYITYSNQNHSLGLTKFDTSGLLMWSKSLSEYYHDPSCLTLDTAGYIYVTGKIFYYAANSFTVKYNPAGDTLWRAIYYPSTNGGSYTGLSISVDNQKNVYITGGESYQFINSYTTIKYDSLGNRKWVSKYYSPYSSTSFTRGYCVKADNKGNCYVTGVTLHSLINGVYRYAPVTIKYGSNGDSIWTRLFVLADTIDFGSGSDIAIDDNENIFIPCYYTIKYDKNGNLLWYKNNNFPVSREILFENNIYGSGGFWEDRLQMLGYDNDRGNVIFNQIYPTPHPVICGGNLTFSNNLYMYAYANDSAILFKYTSNTSLISGNVNRVNNFKLSQNYPNPFNPETKINYELPNDGKVKLMIYDVLGREIKTLVNEVKQAGKYTVEFNGSNFASGVYFYRIESGKFTEVKRMVLVK